jgi:cytochrome c biogenesis protein CcdA
MGKMDNAISTLERSFSESPFWALTLVFWIGAVASLSSCTVIRLPVVLGYVAGSGDSRRRSLLLTCLFAAGLVVSYMLIGATAAFAGGVVHGLLHTSKFLFWTLGTGLFIVGVLVSGLVGAGRLPQRWQHIGERLGKARPAGAIVLGLLLGLVMMPACPLCGAGLLVLATLVVAKNLSLYGLALFFSFALGQSVPLLAVGVLATLVKPDLVKRIRTRLCSAEQRVQLLAGNLLMVAGIYFVVVG